ncbi:MULTISPECIES: hypothetical protein [unclassified Streptomyces]|uniref:hypothetical protein n=1 Tax=unclassified Streptomyces TaxID=2593676 RepID=UPI002252A215|nr:MULTISPECIES: hypothetical protein [unclassified Streptomyces]MCX4645147.1 hypothetical protein [Streptomyces sp. NBC_01446]MCX5326085.1 hypothetical protein [Streptomyces sp. NBC_00120]
MAHDAEYAVDRVVGEPAVLIPAVLALEVQDIRVLLLGIDHVVAEVLQVVAPVSVTVLHERDQ